MKAFKQNPLSILILGLAFAGCSDDAQDAVLSCSNLSVGSSCSASVEGGMIYFKSGELKANEEYVLVVKSDEKPNGTKNLQHNLKVRSDVGSASLDSAEASLIKTVVSRQLGSLDYAPSPLDESIRFGYRNVGQVDAYIPNPLDYATILDNKIIPAHIPAADRQATGRNTKMNLAASYSDLFTISYDDVFQNFGSSTLIQNLNTCLQRVLSEQVGVLGRPISIDGNSAVNIWLTNFQGALGGKTLGLFSPIDRFFTRNGQTLTDSNRSQILYVAPTQNEGWACATTAHEYQHLRNFDAKILSQVSANRRSDMNSMEGLREEDLGINEGLSHIFENLSKESNQVDEHVYKFFTHPHMSSFALEGTYSNNFGNTRSRGLNTLFLYHAIKLAGGSLNITDQATRNFLNRVVLSPKTGFENIAEVLGMSESDLLKDFFTKLIYSLYNQNIATQFVPPVEMTLTPAAIRVTRGIEIIERGSPIQNIAYMRPKLHPYQFDMKTLSLSDDNIMPSQGVGFYKFITPSNLRPDSEISFSTDGKNFSVFVVRVR